MPPLLDHRQGVARERHAEAGPGEAPGRARSPRRARPAPRSSRPALRGRAGGTASTCPPRRGGRRAWAPQTEAGHEEFRWRLSSSAPRLSSPTPASTLATSPTRRPPARRPARADSRAGRGRWSPRSAGARGGRSGRARPGWSPWGSSPAAAAPATTLIGDPREIRRSRSRHGERRVARVLGAEDQLEVGVVLPGERGEVLVQPLVHPLERLEDGDRRERGSRARAPDRARQEDAARRLAAESGQPARGPRAGRGGWASVSKAFPSAVRIALRG